MAERTPLSAEKRQGGSVTPPSEENRQKHERGVSVTPLSAEESQNQSDEEFERIFLEELEARSDNEEEEDEGNGVPYGALKEHCPDFNQLLLRYRHQIRQSDGFDIDDFPGHPVVIAPVQDFKKWDGLLMELATRAIQEYNEKECNVFKYKVLKIEKVNYMLSSYEQFFMTVKVLNFTLATPIESFQIHAAKGICDDDKVILLCRPKEEGAIATMKSLAGSFAKPN